MQSREVTMKSVTSGHIKDVDEDDDQVIGVKVMQNALDPRLANKNLGKFQTISGCYFLAQIVTNSFFWL